MGNPGRPGPFGLPETFPLLIRFITVSLTVDFPGDFP